MATLKLKLPLVVKWKKMYFSDPMLGRFEIQNVFIPLQWAYFQKLKKKKFFMLHYLYYLT